MKNFRASGFGSKILQAYLVFLQMIFPNLTDLEKKSCLLHKMSKDIIQETYTSSPEVIDYFFPYQTLKREAVNGCAVTSLRNS